MMNCESFDQLLLDELYDELDEVTHAAAKRHAAECSKCASNLNAYRAVRHQLSAMLEEPPVDLEAAIFAKLDLPAVASTPATEQRPIENVVPPRRHSGWVSRAGRWAMRPQTAMAALFMLMVGSSALLLRSRAARKSGSDEIGAPSPRNEPEAIVASPTRGGDGFSSKAKTGELGRKPAVSQQQAATDEESAPSKDQKAVTGPNDLVAKNLDPSLAATPKSASLKPEGYRADAPAALQAPVNLPPPMASGASGVAADLQDDRGGSSGGLGNLRATKENESSGNFSKGMDAYKNRQYGEAAKKFDADANANPQAALWAARSVRNSPAGCAGAVRRYDAVIMRAPGTPAANDAALESAQCLRSMGAHDAADARLRKLVDTPSYAERARTELARSPARSSGVGKAGAHASPKSAAPAPAEADRAPAPTEKK